MFTKTRIIIASVIVLIAGLAFWKLRKDTDDGTDTDYSSFIGKNVSLTFHEDITLTDQNGKTRIVKERAIITGIFRKSTVNLTGFKYSVQETVLGVLSGNYEVDSAKVKTIVVAA